MPKSLVLIGVFVALAINWRCDNTLEINGDYKEQVVVYGLLDFGADTNFIRIQRSFLGENTSALTLAQQAGQNYFAADELTVYLEQWKNGTLLLTIPCTYVDGDTLGIEKDTGIFANSPNILYRITAPIDSASQYKLFAIKHDTGDTISAQTNIVQGYYLYYPTKPDTYIDLSDTGNITYTCKQAVNAMMYDLVLTFRYAEVHPSTGDSVVQSIDWVIFDNKEGTNPDGNSTLSYSLRRHSFYTFLASAIEQDTTLIRYAIDLTYTWYAGGTELYDQYLNILANLGLNQDYISPEYTNITNGIGIFSSRHMQIAGNIKLSDASLDTLSCGSITSKLRFIGSPTSGEYPGCWE